MLKFSLYTATALISRHDAPKSTTVGNQLTQHQRLMLAGPTVDDEEEDEDEDISHIAAQAVTTATYLSQPTSHKVNSTTNSIA